MQCLVKDEPASTARYRSAATRSLFQHADVGCVPARAQKGYDSITNITNMEASALSCNLQSTKAAFCKRHEKDAVNLDILASIPWSYNCDVNRAIDLLVV